MATAPPCLAAAFVSHRVARPPRSRCPAGPSRRGGGLAYEAYAEANTSPGKVKGRRPAVSVERAAPAGAWGAGRPALLRLSPDDRASGTFSSMEITSLGKWSHPSLSSCLFHSEPKKATEEECIHCPRFSKSCPINYPYIPGEEQMGCTFSGPKPKERSMDSLSYKSAEGSPRKEGAAKQQLPAPGVKGRTHPKGDRARGCSFKELRDG